mmetsp:Transcript_31446/g.50440  ORF Transcript_31446/g.50440 Transcript_31446/m.50440 type:complete len:166 (-) Transcript_31446:49-546(-)|eukprot:CAMPEP_0169209134 /NCGR_PEP_ID=MMETSP1016-20121227/14505_1 /TAXON_ID=342587 /ORGANISM="Karlodinium micrum, Strain CCMP2283" /LENGTH=165 /DNA_ID=CAMNT_0009286559 /DNA_START=55 /DNA_END=552 /DNA_ORIENTATION=-
MVDPAVAAEGEPEPPKKKSKKKKEKEDKDDRYVRFRNYLPRTPELRDFCIAKVTSADVEAMIDKEIAEAMNTAEDQEAVMAIAPRKPNWDLKRDVGRKMQVLQARTDRAVVQLIRQRIKQDKAAPKPGAEARPEDEGSRRDEASLAMAKQVMKAAPGKDGELDDD